MEDGQIRSSYGQSRYGVQTRAPDIVDISVLQIRLSHDTIGGRHPWRFPPNAASIKMQCDDHCGSVPSRCIQSWEWIFRLAHLGETYIHPSAAHVGWEGYN